MDQSLEQIIDGLPETIKPLFERILKQQKTFTQGPGVNPSTDRPKVVMVPVGPDRINEVIALERQCHVDPFNEETWIKVMTCGFPVFTMHALPHVGTAGGMGAGRGVTGLGPALGYVLMTAFGGRWRIDRVGIEPSVRGQGWGKELLTQALEIIAGTSMGHEVTLRVRADNERAMGLYESFGFKKQSVIKDYYEYTSYVDRSGSIIDDDLPKAMDAVCMILDLHETEYIKPENRRPIGLVERAMGVLDDQLGDVIVGKTLSCE